MPRHRAKDDIKSIAENGLEAARPLRVAYVCKMYPRFSETFIVNEVLALEKRGVDVGIYSLKAPTDGRFHATLSQVRAVAKYLPEHIACGWRPMLEAQRSVQAANPTIWKRTAIYATKRALRRRNMHAVTRLMQAGTLAEQLRKEPVDHIHAHFASASAHVAMLASRLTGIPFSFTAHAKDIYQEDVDLDLLREKIRAARFVVTVSDFNRAYLQELAGDNTTPIVRLYNGIDRTRFLYSGQERRQNGLILAVSRLVEKKGFDTLVGACKLLRDRRVGFTCTIVGSGPLEGALSRRIVEYGLGDKVTLIGPRPQEVLGDLYSQASVFALPARVARDGNKDGLPTVLLEAMSTGLSVVSTTVTGIPEIITSGQNGLLVPPDDAHALADALQRVLTDSAAAKRMGEAASHTVAERFDVDRQVAQLHALFDGRTRVPSNGVYHPPVETISSTVETTELQLTGCIS